MIIYLVIVIVVIFFLKYYGNKAGFDKLETIWLIQFLTTILILYYSSPIKRIIFLFIILRSPLLRPCIITWGGVLISILSKLHFKSYRLVAELLFKTDIHMKHNLVDIPKEPTIFLANYPSNYVEYLIHGLLGEKVCLLTYGPAVKIVKHIYGPEHVIAVKKGDFESLQRQIYEKLLDGFHIFAYIERDYYNRKSNYHITDLRTGMFQIAKNIGYTITPIAIDHIDHTYGILDHTIFNLHIGKTTHVTDVEKSKINVYDFLSKNLRRMAIKKQVTI